MLYHCRQCGRRRQYECQCGIEYYDVLWNCVPRLYTVSQKNCAKLFVKIVRTKKFIKCLPNLIIFGTQIAQKIGLCEVH